MFTAAAVAEVYSSPFVDAVLTAIWAVAGLTGVLLIIKNHTGDRVNFGLAAETAQALSISGVVRSAKVSLCRLMTPCVSCPYSLLTATFLRPNLA